jgi:hypothetical protein
MRSAVALVGVVFVLGVLPASASPARAGQADFAITLSGPSETSVGGRAIYEITVTNAGPDKEPAKLRLTRGRGATTVEEGEHLSTAGQTTSKGTCAPDPLGVICRPGALAAGDTVEVEVEVKIFDADLPKLAVQATVAPELIPAVDANPANDHAEVSTPVREPIAVDGLPDNCATRPFTVTVKTSIPKAKKTKVMVDGKVIDTSGASKMSVKIKPHDLDKGSHQLGVAVQGGSGPALATLQRKFKTC